MSEQFDPYYKWLGIPPEEQPPNHYRLLGLPPFVDDLDVIENAADQRMAHIRKFQAGKNGELSQKILNELSSARVCLLNPDNKKPYDQNLQAQIAAVGTQPVPQQAPQSTAAQVPTAVPVATNVETQPSPIQPFIQSPGIPATGKGRSRRKQMWVLPAFLAIGSIGLLIAIAVGLFAFKQETVADNPDKPIPNDPGTTPDVPPKNPTAPKNPTTPKDPPSTPSDPKPIPPPQAPTKPASQFAVRFTPHSFVILDESQELVSHDRPFTVELWMRCRAGELMRIVGDRAVGAQHPNLSGQEMAGWRLSFFKRNERPPIVALQNEGNDVRSALGERWFHLALSNDGNEFRLFQNGRIVFTRESSWDLGLTETFLGDSPYDRRKYPEGNSIYFDLAAFRVTDDCLYLDPFTPSARFTADKSTLVLLDFSRPVSTTISDRSGKGHHGRMSGAQWVRATDGVAVAAPAAEIKINTEPTPATKLAVPTSDEQQIARTQIRDVLKNEFELATTPDKKAALARQLFNDSNKVGETPVNQYVLLDEAAAMSLAAGEFEFAFEVADAIVAKFDADPLDATADMLGKCQAAVRTTAQREFVMRRALDIVDLMVANDRMDLASAAISTAQSFVGKAGIAVDLRVAVRDKVKEFGPLNQQWLAAEKAKEVLKSNPDDPQANHVAGLYLALVQRDWQHGLQHLVKCNVETLKQVSQKDLAGADEVVEQISIADAWWNLSSEFDGRLKESMQLRSRHWYLKAEPKAPAFAKTKIQDRLSATEKFKVAESGPAPNIEGDQVGLVGRFEIPEQPPIFVNYKSSGFMNYSSLTSAVRQHGIQAATNDAKLELHGYLQLDQPGQVFVRLRGGPTTSLPGSSILLLNGNKVAQLDSSPVRDVKSMVDLPQGKVSIVWQMTEYFGDLQLEFKNEKGDLLTLMHDDKQAANARTGPGMELVVGQRANPEALNASLAEIFRANGQVGATRFTSRSKATPTVTQMSDLASDYFEITWVAFPGPAANNVDDAFALKLKSLPHLERLTLGNCKISDTGLAVISEFPNLRALNLRNCQAITNQGLRHVTKSTSIEDIDVSSTKITAQGLAHFKNLPLLRKLNAGETDFGPSEAAVIAEFPSLSELSLDGCDSLSQDTIENVLMAPKLSNLSARDSRFDDSAAVAIKDHMRLVSLNLGSTEITDTALEQIKTLPRLSQLTLHRVANITNTGLKHLAEMRNLQVLDLSGNKQITDEAIEHLKSARNLRMLNASDSSITAEGIADLKKALPQCQVMFQGKRI